MSCGSMEFMDRTDSLEDWVAVKCNVFTDNVLPPRLSFFVSWNENAQKVAVSCRLNSRTMADMDDKHSRSGLFSWQEIKGAHELLCLVHPSLILHLPPLPDEGWGLWAYLTTQQTPSNIEDICMDLEQYLKVALEICKEKLVMSVLFEEHSPEDYFENVSELRYRGYKQSVENVEDEFKNVIFLRESCTTMFDVAEIYAVEDETLYRFNVVLAELYNYQLQPFLDMRELAKSKLRVAKAELECTHLGDRRKSEAAQVITEWQGHYEHALDSTQQLYIAYYKHTSTTLLEMKSRMLEDQKCFGKNAYDIVGAERLLRIEEDYYLERLQLLENIKTLYAHERDKVKEEIVSVRESCNLNERLSELEHSVYDWQIKIYDLQLKIAGEEESLYRTQLAAITRNNKSNIRMHVDKDERVVFYDAVEDMSNVESSDDDEEDTAKSQTSARVQRLQQNMSRVNRRRAKIRTRKTALISQSKNRERQRLDELHDSQKHHTIQQKREEQKNEVIKKQEFILTEREKTIDRLKNYKMKYPAPVTIKPPRYQPHQPPSSKTTAATKQSSPTRLPRLSLAEHKKASRMACQNSDPADLPVYIHESYDTTDSMQPDASVTIGQSSTTTPLPPPPPPPPPLPPPPLNPPPTSGLINVSKSLKAFKRQPHEPTTTLTHDTPSSLVLTESSLAQASKMLKSIHERSLKPPLADLGPPKLDSILKGRKNLLPATADRRARRILPPKDPVDDIMSMIRNGVVLRPIIKSTQQRSDPRPAPPSDSHLSLLRQRLSHINDVTAGSSDDSDDDDNDFDFDD